MFTNILLSLYQGNLEKHYKKDSESLWNVSFLQYMSSPFIAKPVSIRTEETIICTFSDMKKNLSTWKREERYVPVILYQILQALKHASEKGFSVRELAPSDIRIISEAYDSYPRVKVCLFEQRGNSEPDSECSYIMQWLGIPKELFDDIILRKMPYSQALEDSFFHNGYVYMLRNDVSIEDEDRELIYDYPEKEEKLELLNQYLRVERRYFSCPIVGLCTSLLSRINLKTSAFDIVDSVIDIALCLYTGKPYDSPMSFNIVESLNYDLLSGSIPLGLHKSLSDDTFEFLLTCTLLEGQYTYEHVLYLHDFCSQRKCENTSYIRELMDTYSMYIDDYDYNTCRKILYKIDGY